MKKNKTEKIPLLGQFQVKGFFAFYYSLCTPYGAGDSATIDAGLVGIVVYVTGEDDGTIGFSPVDLISSSSQNNFNTFCKSHLFPSTVFLNSDT